MTLQSTTDDLMRFVKELRQANSALVDAFEKSKKRQQAEKRRMKQDLVSYMNRSSKLSYTRCEYFGYNHLHNVGRVSMGQKNFKSTVSLEM